MQNCEGLCTLADKFVFLKPSEERLVQLEKLLSQRLDDGQGECFLELGVGDGQNPGLSPADMDQSVSTAQQLAERLNVTLIHLRDRTITGSTHSSSTRLELSGSPADKHRATGSTRPHDHSLSPNPPSVNKRLQRNSGPQTDQPGSESPVPTPTSPSSSVTPIVKEFLLRKQIPADDFVDVRVAVVGNVDAGKSTLLGVLTHGELDNGRGQARLRLLRHQHEAETGRTSSVTNDILGFDFEGTVVNKPVHGQLHWSTICKAAAKVVTFIDLAGHERYLKTTIFGMTGHAPDYAMFMVGANAGVVGMAKEHLGLALALNVPVFVVVTKIDMCPANVLQETMNLLFRILKSPGCRKMPLLISSKDDVICSATNFSSERICPVFSVSNVTGENLDLLKMFLNLLHPRSQPRLTDPAHFQIDDIFSVPGVGNVVSGTCLAGVIKMGDPLLLGPDPMGQFVPVVIRGIQRKRLPVDHVRGGQTASFALKKLQRNQLRKGMVIVSPELNPRACLEFLAEVLILHHPTTISVGYQAMVHAGPVRQTATILAFGTCDRLRTGDRDMVKFRFIKYPEYLYVGLRLIFREGKTKAVGTVTEMFPSTDVTPQVTRGRFAKRHLSQFTGPKSQPTDACPQTTATPTSPTEAGQTESDQQRPAYSKQRRRYRRGPAATPSSLSSRASEQSTTSN